jgi:hypothetical protein
MFIPILMMCYQLILDPGPVWRTEYCGPSIMPQLIRTVRKFAKIDVSEFSCSMRRPRNRAVSSPDASAGRRHHTHHSRNVDEVPSGV